MSSMSRRRYSRKFKEEAVKLVLEQGLTRAQAARDLGISESVLGRWVNKAQAAGGGALDDDLRQELARLRRENKILRQEREILKKAAAFFAKESL